MSTFHPFTLRTGHRVVEYCHPVVMGVLNATPDSFYAASRLEAEVEKVVARARDMVAAGADIIDVGACSTRPGSKAPDATEERRRLDAVLPAIKAAIGETALLSVDTYRADIAAHCVSELGADIINDISGGAIDEAMFETVASLRVPYVLSHMRGTPDTMSSLTDYEDVTAEVISELSPKLYQLEEMGVADIIIDPGFGFAKTLEQNYSLLANLEALSIFGRPILAGMSRKSMLTRLLDIDASEAEIPTAIVGTLALERGASMLRVHDVLSARQSVKIVETLNANA